MVSTLPANVIWAAANALNFKGVFVREIVMSQPFGVDLFLH